MADIARAAGGNPLRGAGIVTGAADDNDAKADRVFQALGDPTRRSIVAALVGAPRTVTALAGPLGITVTAVSQHLQVLENCGLVKTEKIGRTRTCRLETAGLDVLGRWVEERRSVWDKRLDRLGQMFEAGEKGTD